MNLPKNEREGKTRRREITRLLSGASIAMGWTGVHMFTPLLPEVVSEINANPVSFYEG